MKLVSPLICVKLALNINQYISIIAASVGTYDQHVYVQFISVFNDSRIVIKLFYNILINAGNMV